MKRQEPRSPATRGQQIAMGLSACSGSLVVGLTAARDLGAPVIVGVVLAVAGLVALLTYVTRAR